MLPTVVIINDAAHVDGGAAAIAVADAIGLAEAGFRVTFIAAIGPVAPALLRNNIQMVLAQSLEVNSDSPARLMWRSVWNMEAAKATARVLAELDSRECVVHAHSWHRALSASVLRTALDGGFRVVCTLHDYGIACPTTGFFDRRTMHVCPLQPLSLKCLVRPCTRRFGGKGLAVLRQVLQVQARIPHDIRHFVTLSELSESILRQYFDVGASVYRVRNPLVAPRTPPVAVARNTLYSMVGRLNLEKGVLVFAEAARRGGFKSLFAGEGPSRGEILRTNPAAEITGWLPAAEVSEQLKRSRCLVFPSLWYEAQPLVVVEASAMGIPSIVSDNCAARELIENEVTGLLFRSGDVESLLAALWRLEDPQLATTLGLNAYKRFWADPPTIERHVRDLAAVYNRILES